MRIGALVEEKPLGVACDVVVDLLWGLEVNVVKVPHQLSVIWHRIVPGKVNPLRKVILRLWVFHL